MQKLTLFAVAIVLACGPGSILRAELPSIRFDRINPLGAQAGTSVEVEILGRDTEDVSALRFDHPGLKAELVKPNRFKLSVAGDVAEGTYDVRMIGRFGASNPRLFAVSRDLVDVAETEPNNVAGNAQTIAVNSAVHGTSDGNGQDVFRFPARKGDRILIDCQAQKLESAMDGTLILSSSAGQILANSGDYHGRDPFIDFIAPDDGEYFVVVHDLSYRGGFPYRLIVTNRPHVENVFPRAVEPGKAVELVALGRNFKTGKFAPAKPGDLPLEEFRFPLTMPADLAGAGRYVFLEHPTDHSVLPTGATCTLDGLQVRVPCGAGALHPVPIIAAGGPVTLEAEPNNDKTKPQPIALPAIVSGRFDEARDADWYAFDVHENGQYVFEVYSERISGQADPYLVVIDDKDNNVVELDDYGHRINAFDAHLRDPYGTANLEAKRTYRVLVQDRYGRGGPRFQYVLAIRKPIPDFHVAAIHSENPGPAGTTLWRGGAAFVDVVIHQQDGFNSPITITAEGLPAGIHATPTVVNNNTRGLFVLWADADAAETDVPIKLFASGTQDGKTLRREVRPTTRVWTETNLGASVPMRELVVGVRDRAPYSLKIVPEKMTVEAGKKAELKLVASRLWPEFTEKITIIPLGFPGNFNFSSFNINAGQTDASLAIDVQAGTRPGDYTLSVLGQAQVPYNKDAKAAQKPNTLVSMPSLPVTITVTAK
ncbi:MAG: PPC domain-containing protein [Planctomycetia bacterium]|nr:PPC domain-containing protein [Planctomycetia bacterium]